MKKLLFFSGLLLLTACSATNVDSGDDTNPPTDESQLKTSDVEAITYQSEYGFTLTLPKSWEGYTVDEKEGEFGFTAPILYFKTPEAIDIFAISVFTDAQWTELQAQDGPKPQSLGRNEKYVFGWDHTQDGAGIEKYEGDLDGIRASFTAL